MKQLPSSIILKQNGFATIEVDNHFACATISLLGAQVLHYSPKHDQCERLWLSNKAIVDGSRPIRGGIPVCWPWFGDHKKQGYPAHGYVRTQYWEITHSLDTSTHTEITLSPADTHGKGFEGSAKLSLNIKIGKELSIQLETTNIGNKSFSYTCALHSYFKVNDIKSTELFGLSGKYSDKIENYNYFETPSPYFFNAETDRIHLNPVDRVSISCAQLKTEVLSAGHDSIVVWNPWTKNSKALIDMEEDSYKQMVCVETAITQGKTLQVGESHLLEQIIK